MIIKNFINFLFQEADENEELEEIRNRNINLSNLHKMQMDTKKEKAEIEFVKE